MMLKLAVDNNYKDTDLVKSFCRQLLIQYGLKPNTIYNYRKLTRRFTRIVDTQRPSHEQVEDFVASLYDAGYSHAHIVNNIKMLKRYMEFIEDPIQIGYPRKPKQTIKDPLTEAEIAVILAATKDIREKAILSLLAYSGIRNNELCGVKVRDVDFGRNRLHVELGKGLKSRDIPISGECTTILLQYIAEYPRGPESHLFTTLRKNNPYQPHDVRRMLKDVASRTHIKKRVYPHIFRHSLATNMIARGANLLTIKDVLGHAFIDTTMIYARTNPQRVANEYNMYAPSYS